MKGEDRPLPQGWTLNEEAVEQTQAFWADRTNLPMSSDEAKDALFNMASFVALLSSWNEDSSLAADETESKGGVR